MLYAYLVPVCRHGGLFLAAALLGSSLSAELIVISLAGCSLGLSVPRLVPVPWVHPWATGQRATTLR
jgi:hypothetical protein